jgi:hypothetical protein
MMRRVLLVLGVFGTVGLVASAAIGYSVTHASDPQMQAHALISLTATLVLMFSHTWIVLYLVATGRVMAQGVASAGLDATLLERARRLRLHTLPWLLAAILSLIATFLLGSAAFAGRLLAMLHHVFFYVTLILQIVAMRVEGKVLAEHDEIGLDVARRLATDATDATDATNATDAA